RPHTSRSRTHLPRIRMALAGFAGRPRAPLLQQGRLRSCLRGPARRPPTQRSEMTVQPLRVVSLASELAGAYCARLLADAGAEIVRAEDPSGDSLRAWSASGSAVGDGALFKYLAGGT